jgi:transmembrane sensor
LKTELIELFFQKQCTPEEAAEVTSYLKANPALLEKYLSTHEWNAAEGNTMPEEFWNEVWQSIQKRNKAKIISVKLKRVAVAACLILMIGTVYYYYYSIPVKQISKPLAGITVLPGTQLHIATNNTKEIKTVVLEDSSVVQLSPNSSIQYDNPFPNNKREILLKGEAKFIVAKNKMKPFTVYTGILATTALGTIFSIKTIGNKNDITVKLFRGKVVIHAEGKDLKGWNKDVYLLPGEEMKFNIERMLVSVEKIRTANTNSLAKVKTLSADSSTNILTFSNTLLPQVMQKLSAYYNVKIQYDSTLIGAMNFTGTITKKDSLPVILKAITQMNNLNVIQEDGNFTISKLQQ